MIIGTVSFGGKRGGLLLGFAHADFAVFLGHHAQRLPNGRAVALGLDERRRHGLDTGKTGALAEVLEGLPAIRKVGQLGGGQRQLFGEFQGLARTSLATLPNAASTDMPDCTQISSMSRASGKACLIDSWRLEARFETKTLGR